jgi:2'-5' RNA ligase
MSRGVVVWPDAAASSAILGLWESLEDAGIPTLHSHTHRRHRPHLSLYVAEDLPPDETLAAVGRVPSEPIPLHIENIGLFPQGVLFLACVPNSQLLDEQVRVRSVVKPLAIEPWPFFEEGRWTPHLTVSWSLEASQIDQAFLLLSVALPIHGLLDRGGVEDGRTGDNWMH